MSRRYYVEPPVQGNIPTFLKKAYLADHVRDLIQWAKQEYTVGMNYLNKHASARTILYFQHNVSAMRVLAENEAFREILDLMNDQVWNKLDAKERRFIRRTYELFRALS